jgi:hypothetical protein
MKRGSCSRDSHEIRETEPVYGVDVEDIFYISKTNYIKFPIVLSENDMIWIKVNRKQVKLIDLMFAFEDVLIQLNDEMLRFVDTK